MGTIAEANQPENKIYTSSADVAPITSPPSPLKINAG
jgi:hypothetical protein